MNREEATKLSEQTIAELASALEQGRSEALTNYLSVMAKFHDYSFRNCLLIAMQKPDATYVAGFNRWKQLNRFVRKGEKGIAILAPLVYRKKADDSPKSEPEPTADEQNVATLRGFKVVHVFDVSQTEGDELPQFATLNGDPGEKLSQLEEFVQRHEITLKYEPLSGGALGVSRGGEIVIVPELSTAEKFSVLVHEFAHERLHHGERKKETSKTVRETEAEAVAFVVCKAIGLDPGTKSADYIQLYAGDKAVLMESLDYIQKTAAYILAGLDASHVEVVVAHAA
jgi:antirestriction protein ArdC